MDIHNNIPTDIENRQDALRELIEEHLTGKDVIDISTSCDVAKSTVYKYLNISISGAEKNLNQYTLPIYNKVVNKAISILKEKSIELSSLIEKLQ